MRELEREPTEAAGADADTTSLPRLAIVGRGRVGGAVAIAARLGALRGAAPELVPLDQALAERTREVEGG